MCTHIKKLKMYSMIYSYVLEIVIDSICFRDKLNLFETYNQTTYYYQNHKFKFLSINDNQALVK